MFWLIYNCLEEVGKLRNLGIGPGRRDVLANLQLSGNIDVRSHECLRFKSEINIGCIKKSHSSGSSADS